MKPGTRNPRKPSLALLTVNAGSSSVRLATYAGHDLVRTGQAHHQDPGDARDLLRAFADRGASSPTAIAHRVVHGGARLVSPALIEPWVAEEILRAAPLAPLHNPRALEWIAACRGQWPSVQQVAVFDTSFFAALPAAAATYALPRALMERIGARRRGFHGIAHEAMWLRWLELRPASGGQGRVISFQLGSGCSVAAVRDGVPLDTSMGFSPLEGLVMATRAGDVDPGLLLHLQKAEALDAAALERMLSEDSGLRGLAGTGDMKALLAARGDAGARLAIDVYCHRARRYLGAFLAILGGADAILFGGGVGEHAPEIRARILAGMAWAGISLDEAANAAATGREGRIDAASVTEAWVIEVDEARLMASKARDVVEKAGIRSDP